MPPRKKLFMCLCAAAVSIGGSVVVGEAGSRLLFRERLAEIEKIQARLRLDPRVGYRWQAHLDLPSGFLSWLDQTPQPLTTDADGNSNDPRAIARLERGERPDIVGVGDSFLHDGARVLYQFFDERSAFYYSVAMHRYSPPQYNQNLADYGLRSRPRWIVYGIYENDFGETDDFERWRESGRDWVDYHSGTWFGAPTSSRVASSLRARFPGLLMLKARFVPRIVRGADTRTAAGVAGYVGDALRVAQRGGSRFLLVLIPGKETMFSDHATAESRLYDELLDRVRHFPGLDLIDLRAHFRSCCGDPRALYYEKDGHWNFSGMREGGKAIWSHVERTLSARAAESR